MASRNDRNHRLGDGFEQADVVQLFIGNASRQPAFLVAIADQHEVQRHAAQRAGCVQQRVQRIRQAHRAGIADNQRTGFARRRQRLRDVVSQPRRRGSPVVQRDAVGHDVQLAQVQPMRGHVLVHLGQHRHDHVGIAVGCVLGGLHEMDERVARRHARQLDRAQTATDHAPRTPAGRRRAGRCAAPPRCPSGRCWRR